MADDDAVEVSVYIAARPETVFAYFTDPGRYVQWMGRDATLQPVPGGSYRICMQDGVQAAGEFVEIDPPRRVVFTWGWTHDPAVPPGTTRVVLRHHDLPGDGQRDHHRNGWQLYLSRLQLRIGGGDPGPDPNT